MFFNIQIIYLLIVSALGMLHLILIVQRALLSIK